MSARIRRVFAYESSEANQQKILRFKQARSIPVLFRKRKKPPRWCGVTAVAKCGSLWVQRNRANVPAIFADIERSGFQRRSILLLWADTIRDRGLAVMECVSLPRLTITPRSSIMGAPGPGTN